jgi:hypothetical protein
MIQKLKMIKIFLSVCKCAELTSNCEDIRDIVGRLKRNVQYPTNPQISVLAALGSLADSMEIQDKAISKEKQLNEYKRTLRDDLAVNLDKKTKIEKFIKDKKIEKRFGEIKKLKKLLNEKKESLEKAKNELENLRLLKEQEKYKMKIEIEDNKNLENELDLNLRHFNNKLDVFNKSIENINEALGSLDNMLINRNILIEKTMEIEDLKGKYFKELEECYMTEELVDESEKYLEKLKIELEIKNEKLKDLKKNSEKYSEMKKTFDMANQIAKQLEDVKEMYLKIERMDKEKLAVELKENEIKNETLIKKRQLEKLKNENEMKRKEVESLKKELENLPNLLKDLQKSCEKKGYRLVKLKQNLKDLERETDLIKFKKKKIRKMMSQAVGGVIVMITVLIINRIN